MLRTITRTLGRIALFMPGGYSIRPAALRLRGVNLGERVWISQWVYVDELYPEAITIGRGSTVGLRVSIFAHFHWGPMRSTNGSRPVVIGANVFIGPHCVIMPGTRIGDGAVIKAGTVVSRNVPPNIFFGDSPGRPLARITIPLGPDFPYEEFVRGLRPIGPATAKSATEAE